MLILLLILAFTGASSGALMHQRAENSNCEKLEQLCEISDCTNSKVKELCPYHCGEETTLAPTSVEPTTLVPQTTTGQSEGSCKDDSECNLEDCFYCLSSGICGQYHREYCDTYTCGEGDGDCDPGTCPSGTACGVDNFLEYHPLLSACGGTAGAEVCVSSDCFDHGIDYNGFDLEDGKYVSTESAEACQTECKNNDRCKYWSWVPDYHNSCWLKDGKGQTSQSPGIISGPKYCDDEPIPPTPDSKDIRVMSYNLWGWNALANYGMTQNIYKNIRKFHPDLLGTQEIEAHQYTVAENIGNDYAVAAYSAGHAILYRTSIFDLVKSGNTRLSPEDKWGTRTVDYAQLNHKASGRQVDIFNTHWCVCTEGQCCGETPGYISAQEVESYMNEIRRPGSLLLFTGDLNVFSGFENHRAIRYLKGELQEDIPPIPLEDTFRTANPEGDGTTFPGAGKIDYLFAEKGSTVVSAGTDWDYYGAASDHLPIFAVIKT